MRDVVDVGKGRSNEDVLLALLGEDLFALAHNTVSECSYAGCDAEYV